MNKYSVYVIRYIGDNKNIVCYVGMTSKLPAKRRWYDHTNNARDIIRNFDESGNDIRMLARKGLNYMTIAKALAYFGIDNFKFEVLYENLSKHTAIETEIELISQFDTHDKYFNNSSGGDYVY